jgi:ribosomal protein L15
MGRAFSWGAWRASGQRHGRSRGGGDRPPGAFAGFHGRVAQRAPVRRGQGRGLGGGGGHGHAQQQAQQGAREGERGLAGGMVQPVVAHFHESAGQHVLQEAADELFRRQRHALDLLRCGVAVAKRHGIAGVLADGGIAKGDAVDVAREVAQRVLAVADGLGVHRPVALPRFGGDRREDVRQALAQFVAEARAEDRRERTNRNEEFGVRLFPGAVGGEAAAGRHVVDVGVIDQRAAVGMQDSRQARSPAEPFGVGADVEQRGRGRREQDGERLARMRADRPAQLFGDGERAQVVAHRQEQGLLPAQPLLRVVAAARRAMPVAAGMERPAFLPALPAPPPLPALLARAACLDRAHGLHLVGRHALGVLRAIGRAVAAEDVRQRAHPTSGSSAR